MFDLPQPFGPTTTLTPGENTSRVRSGKDLKPLIVIELRCMESAARPRKARCRIGRCSDSSPSACFLPPAAFQRLSRGGLLGGLLAPPLPPSDRLAVADGGDLEAAVVGRARLVEDVVGYVGSLPGEKLLQRRLEVQHGLGRQLDLL